jgi:hypothetical protein
MSIQRPWLGLDRELDELERKDPKVAAARKQLDDLPEQQARHERHLAARKAVGKRQPPEEEL